MKAKKSLGQNFLTAKGVVTDIIKTADIKEGEKVLEIGPGKGMLTEALLNAGAKVIAVEKDRSLFELLQEKFTNEVKAGQLELVNGDALNLQTMSLRDISRRETNYVPTGHLPKGDNLQPGSYKLASNIPYNITGEILRKFIGGEDKPSRAVLLVQKEVAERIVARNNKESILSLSIKVYGTPKYIKKVPARYFNPAPKVDSAILLVENLRNPFLNKDDEKKFFEMVKTGFAHKRKKLVNNLSIIFEKGEIERIFKICKISENSRAEDIGLEKWNNLLAHITPK